ncbi:hypothetical protein KDX16_30820 [Burkholderia vietnamiensis]|uniref:hypothetical protein n=1 Tax=Burkholderia cepacia complex TaxID=87882 RepID=UPI001B947DE4|nr:MULTISPECIES: hypothetical protein [Burkholderia cepacia complex]MBR7920193.1 hypothetical protein [Burkholderia vietnamiensis]MBR8205285.1 hypothetical protein [Burkholderia vietnamiensis]MCA7889978.1 hypothetical protein [Burkholderia contaminans]HDR9134014.1 hypothetical protein [Burkholderia vietnamiensis]
MEMFGGEIPRLPEGKATEFRAYKELTGQSARNALYRFAAANFDLDVALSEWDETHSTAARN